MRAICALAHRHARGAPPTTSPAAQQAIVRATDAFYDAYWGQARDVTDPAVVEDVLRRILALGGEDDDEQVSRQVLEATGTEGKRILLENTEAAFRAGAFGLPWMVCENDRGEREGFWGVDHLGVMLDFLGLEKPRTGPWKALL